MSVPPAHGIPALQRPAVVLVHGLWTNGWEMYLLGRRLERCGFRAYRFRYSSTRSSLQESAALLNQFLKTLPEETVHFVGHSLGGLVVRRLFLDQPVPRPGRIVTLGTPHRTSGTARRLERGRVGRWALGKSLYALTEPLPPWDGRRELGSIAGSLPIGLGVALGMQRDTSDGTVAVAETLLEGSRAHILLPVSHMGMLTSRAVAEATCLFLHSGRFSNGDSIGGSTDRTI